MVRRKKTSKWKYSHSTVTGFKTEFRSRQVGSKLILQIKKGRKWTNLKKRKKLGI